MNLLYGASHLVGLILRRDRWTLPLWIVLVSLVPISLAASFAQLYPTTGARQAFAELSNSTPATIGVLGYVYEANLGSLVAWRAGLNGAFLIVPISILLIIRHTRVEEEAGRLELLRAGPIGRLAPLAAALITTLGANLVIAILTGAGLVAVGLPASGAFLYGLSGAAAGAVFAALAAITAQLTSSVSTARAMALALFGAAWLLRAHGDLTGAPAAPGWTAWISPVGWVRLTRAFAGDQWWVLLLPLALTCCLLGIAYGLAIRRDLGAGALPARSGRSQAAPSLRSPLALAWRLERGSLLGLSAGVALFGFLLGMVSINISQFVDAPQFRSWAAGKGADVPGDAFVALVVYILGQLTAMYAIALTLRLRNSELQGYADALLAAPVSRLRWAGSQLCFVIANPAMLLAVLGLSIGLGYGVIAGNAGAAIGHFLLRTLSVLPAIWVLAGITTALYGLAPKVAAPVAWGLLIVFLLLELGWELQRISLTLFSLSPFAYVYWAFPIRASALAVLCLCAAVLTAAGLIGFQRRDVGS